MLFACKGKEISQADSAMRFDILDIDVLSDDAAFVLGRWNLERENPIGGYYTLLWKKVDGKWLIVLDHTS